MPLHHVGTQILTTERLTLRRYTEDDEATMFDHISQLHQTSPFSGWQPVYSREEAQQGFANHILAQYERPDFYRWCICMGEQFVGNITLTMLSDTSLLAELGYTINADWRGKGIATEAARAVIDFAFGTVCLNRIEATCAVENVASGAVLRKCGMSHEGCARSTAVCATDSRTATCTPSSKTTGRQTKNKQIPKRPDLKKSGLFGCLRVDTIGCCM